MVKIKTFVTRGKIIESVHESKCIVINYNFKTLLSTKNDNDLIYPRSAIKIFQAIPFINSKAIKKYDLTSKQIAISCSSHCGEPSHIKVLEEWIKKLNINKSILKCGIHNPLNKRSSDRLLLSGNKPNQLHNNCAGKHLGMISGCLSNKINPHHYVDINHPYQILIRDCLEFFTKSKIIKTHQGIDGCSVPQYAFPLKNIAFSMINLLKHYNEQRIYTKEIKILLNSIAKYPELTGSKTIYPIQLMKVSKGKIFAKGGAEGILLFVHKEKKIGGVIKVKDGNERALPSVANEIFKKLKIIEKKELKELSYWSNEIIFNHAKKNIGRIYTKIE